MYKVVEFADTGDEAGGISVIRLEWLTPRKHHCLWPPHRIMSKFNKCLIEGAVPDDTWEIYSVKRIFYETDNLTKAREKAKQAEIESEVGSDYSQISVRRRKKTRKIYDSDTDTSEGKSDDTAIIYPTPPATQIGSTSSTSIPHEEQGIERIQFAADKDSIIESLTVAPSSPLSGSLDLTLTPFLKELAPNSHALDVIAKHLARIETEIKELQVSQNEILHRLRSCSTTNLELQLPDDLKLPCDDGKDLENLETWVTKDENRKFMTTYLSYIGGNKIPVIIRKILEKIFTNKLALSCNWTGKNAKTPLKDLQTIKIIRDAVRSNKIAEKVTDSEIHEVIANWFRFTKDRNGGREARRIKQ